MKSSLRATGKLAGIFILLCPLLGDSQPAIAQVVQGANLLQGIQDPGTQATFFSNPKAKPAQQTRSLASEGLVPPQRVFVEVNPEVDLGVEQLEINNEAIFLRNNQSIGDGKIELFPVKRQP